MGFSHPEPLARLAGLAPWAHTNVCAGFAKGKMPAGMCLVPSAHHLERAAALNSRGSATAIPKRMLRSHGYAAQAYIAQGVRLGTLLPSAPVSCRGVFDVLPLPSPAVAVAAFSQRLKLVTAVDCQQSARAANA